MSANSPRRSSGGASRGMMTVPATVPPQVVSDRSILDSAIGFINEVTLAHQPPIDQKDTITWARFETTADISDPRFGDDWELEGNLAPPLLLILGYGLGVQIWAIPANGEAVEVLSWRHGVVTALRILPTPAATVAVEENARADEPIDAFAEQRPLIALVEGNATSGSENQFCAINFVSLKTGAQVKTIKFKSPVVDILTNRSSVVVTFNERIAVFDARTLENRLSITTCYPSPGINPNPVALGPRWLAYAENKLFHSKRSGGGCDGDGVSSYTATVLNASKSLVKGLRDLGEQVAAGLTGSSLSSSNSKNASFDSGSGTDSKQAGIVTIIDIKNSVKDYSPTSGVASSSHPTAGNDTIVAHFIAHSEALVAMEFDNSGMLLVTADRRGHDFHVFRIQPNPVGPSLAAVHHLYVLHRGDTSAKVQNITLTLDSRWIAVSTLRGTTHVFPITPYGGAMSVRTHSSLHVVNKLSRFHRSAGLSAEVRSNSPISHSESTTFTQSLQPFYNSTLPPFPRPVVVMPLAQLRQPFSVGSPPVSATLAGVKAVTGGSGSGSQRQRLSSLSDDSGNPLSICAIFAKSRSWLLEPPNVTRDAPHRVQRKAVDSLFVMAGHGALIQYDLDTKLASNVAKEKVCDDTPIELEVEAKALWNLARHKEGSQDIVPPLSHQNWLIKNRNSCMLTDSTRQFDDIDDRNQSWLSQVEIITHAGPHRRLWMGPQFVFKTYNTPSGANLSHVDTEAVEIGTSKPSTTTTTASEKLNRTNPLNVPLNPASRSSAVPVLIESGSYSSIEQSPKLMDRFRHDHLNSDFSMTHGDSRLKEDLADAMRESHPVVAESDPIDEFGGHGCESTGSSDNIAFYDALAAEDDQDYIQVRSASAAALANVLPNIYSYDNSASYESFDSTKKSKASIEKVVNPLGTVTTVTSFIKADVQKDILDEVVSQLAAEDTIIHENCDESLFRPVVAIFCDENTLLRNQEEALKNIEQYQPPENISTKLVVPVIAKEVNDELNKREKEKSTGTKSKTVDLTKRGSFLKEEKIILQKYTSSFLTGESEREENFLLFKNVNEKRNRTKCLKKSDILKKNSTPIAMPISDIPSSKVAIKEELPVRNKSIDSIKPDKQPKEIIKPKSDDINQVLQLKVENKIDLKKPPKREAFESKVTKIKNANEEKLLTDETDTPDQSSEAKIKNNKKDMSSDLKLTATIPFKAEQQNKQKLINEKTENNLVTISSPYSQTTSNTAPEDSIRKTKDVIKTKKNNDNDVIIPTQCNANQAGNTSLDEEPNATNEVSEIRDIKDDKKTNNTTKPLVCDTPESCKKILNLEKELTVASSSITTEEEPLLAAIPSSEINANPENPIEICAINQTKKNTVKNKAKIIVHKEQSISKNEEKKLDLQVSKQITLNEKQNENVGKSPSSIMLSDDNISDKSKMCNNEEKSSDSIKNSEKNTKKITNIQENREKKLKETKKTSKEEVKIEHENDSKESVEEPASSKKKEIKQPEVKNVSKEPVGDKMKIEADDCKLVVFNKNSVQDVSKDLESTKIKNKISGDVKEIDNKNTNKHLQTKESEKKSETKNNSSALCSPKNKGKVNPKNEPVKEMDANRKISTDLTIISKENSETKKCLDDLTDIVVAETTLGAGEKINKDLTKKQSAPPATTSAWKTLSGAEMINKNFAKSDSESVQFPLLGAVSKLNTFDKLVPELPTPSDTLKRTGLEEFSVLQPLDPLPPLPALEPLLLMTENKTNLSNISLINFESPLQENPVVQRKITPAPRGFTEQNLILALCGSLHYENEYSFGSTEAAELSPTFSSNRSSNAFEETSIADYKSLTENDDPYMSLEQSSQDTNTTTTNTTNEKFSSTNSSGSDEIVIVEEKKMTKKQKRKKQLQLRELQKQKENQQQNQEIDDEELRPLIAMTESQFDQTTKVSDLSLPSNVAKSDKNQQPLTTQPLINSTTTDSDGPMPATTSDDNAFAIPVPIVHNPHKIKTKKLEHKINLIAAIEAATSSSTSSAEESGVELGRHVSYDNEDPLLSVSSTISTSATTLPTTTTPQTAVGVLKKKTKRRKR